MSDTHPIQTSSMFTDRPPQVSAAVTERAYEVYREFYGDEQPLDRLNQRGGFHVSELITLLYARSFPRSEWQKRDKEATAGMSI